jgi:phosphatidylglycerophosphatase A
LVDSTHSGKSKWHGATLGPLGFLPRASGTWTSLVAAGVGLLFLEWSFIHAIFILSLLLVGIYWIADYLKRVSAETSDPSEVVIDEWVGMWIAMWGLPMDWRWVALAFLTFRFFDIFKPWPVSYFDRRMDALGVMLDDVVAGIMAGVLTHGLLFFCGGM